MSTLPALERGPGDRPVGALDGEDVLCGQSFRLFPRELTALPLTSTSVAATAKNAIT